MCGATMLQSVVPGRISTSTQAELVSSRNKEIMMKTSKIELAKESPTKVFDLPDQVLAARIPEGEKSEILKSWEDEAHQLQAAADENMTGGESSRLGEIRSAIDKLSKSAKG